MIKLLMLALIGFVFYSFYSGLRQKFGRRGHQRNRTPQGETMVEDPQCGTFLPLSDAIRATIKGQVYYFCSKKCLNEFKKS